MQDKQINWGKSSDSVTTSEDTDSGEINISNGGR